MAEFDIDVHELEDYAQVLRRAANAGALAFTDIAQKYRNLTMDTARQLVRVKTGELKRSIGPTPGEASVTGLSANWEVTARHAAPIEYGFIHYRSKEKDKKVGPFPYVRPALAKHRKAYVRELAERSGVNLQVGGNPRPGVSLRGD